MWEDAYLVMPWGKGHYRFRNLDDSKYPLEVEAEIEIEPGETKWMHCPNFNVALRIQSMLRS